MRYKKEYDVSGVSYKVVSFTDVTLNAEIVALGKEVFPEMATAEEMHTLTDGYDDCQGEVIAMIKNNELVGFAFLLHYPSACFLNYFAIKPIFQKKGMGSLLLNHVVECAKGKPVLLTTWEPNVDYEDFLHHQFIKDFYIKNGFRCLSIRWFDPDDINRNMIFMLHGNLNEETCLKIMEDVQVMWDMQYVKNHPDFFKHLTND